MIRVVAALLLLAGCAAAPVQAPTVSPKRPAFDRAAIVALLQPCPIEKPKKYTGDEVTRVANARGDALVQCNKDKAAALEKINSIPE